MLAPTNTIRDVSRALPALVSGPKIEVPVSTGLLDALANELRERHASLHPVIDRAGHALAEAMKRHDPEETADPQGEGAVALEQAESYFKDSRAELQRLRKACVELGASPSHRVFTALRNLDELYVSIIAIMQEVRWSVLIFDGVRDRADPLPGVRSPPRRSGSPRFMATSSPPPLRAILEPTGTFRRNARRLPPRMSDQLGLAVNELLKGELSPGRNFEEFTNMPGVYSVRSSGSYRFVFGVTDGVADPIAVGPHDQAYADAVRRHRTRRR